MILRILTLICVSCIYPSLGKMDLTNFKSRIEQKCFQDKLKDSFQVNGQEIPLSSTLENFIALAEKFEAANPGLNLKDEVAYFLSEYVFENIKFIGGKAAQWNVEIANFEIINSFWDPEDNHQIPSYEEPFSDAEICSLYYMISHSMLSPDTELYRSYVLRDNSSSNGDRTIELNQENYRPQELGVVAIQGTDAAISLSRILMGLFVGLKQDRASDLTSYERVQKLMKQNENGRENPVELPQNKTVDALFAVTLAEVLMLANWTGNDRRRLAEDGEWVSIPLSGDKKTEGFCPMAYIQKSINDETFIRAYSYSSVRGAADGLILGLEVKKVYDKKDTTKLSQILRMYYSPDGLTVYENPEEPNIKRISFCSRNDAVDRLDTELKHQMNLYGYLIALDLKDVPNIFRDAQGLYSASKGIIFSNRKEIQDYCDRPTSLEKPEDLPREIFLDVIVVMDSADKENFQDQQLITGYLAKHLDLRYTGSRTTILLDRKVTSGDASTSRVELMAAVLDTNSSSCAACMVGQLGFIASSLDRDQVITGIDHFLQERKEKEAKYSGVNGKVVVYFNYEKDDVRGNNKIQGRLEKALRDFHLHHQDVAFYAVGLDPELLKKYAKNDPSLVFLGSEGTQEEVGNRLFNKISFAPALLQYTDCKEAKNEKAATFENFVAPHAIQHYKMPAEYFYKSTSLSFTFESTNGYIRVCHNRATSKPENEMKSCKNTTGNGGIEFKFSNPCQNFKKEACSPFYFSVMGMESNSQEMRLDTKKREYCKDITDPLTWCRTLDQVHFKVYHTGVRCSGCLGLGAPPAVILFTILLTFFIYKRF